MANPIPPGFFVFALRFVGIDIDIFVFVGLFSSSRGGGGGVTWQISHYLSWVVSIGKQVGRGEEVLTWRLGPLSAMASQLGTTQTQNEYQRLKYK
jgi:hypothetical protein